MTWTHAWTAATVGAAVVGLGWAWRSRNRAAAERALIALLPLAMLAPAAEVLSAAAALPTNDVTALRVVPGFALATGHPIYSGPAEGPIIDFMYGPIGAVTYVPVALATTPSAAIAIAGAINAAVFFAPVAWLHARMVGGLAGLAAMLAFVLVVCRDGGLAYSALTVHVDAPALGLAALAAGMLVVGPRDWRGRAMSATALVLGAWTKQTIVPILGVLPLYVLAVDGKTAAWRYLAWIVGVGVVVSIVLLATFDAAAMMFNMVAMPACMPWYGESEGGKLAGLWLSTHVFVQQQSAKLALLTVLVVAGMRTASSLRRWLATEPWTLMLFIGMAQIPIAVVGGAKVGGYLNNHSMASYFLAAAVTLAIGTMAAGGRRGWGRVLLVALLAGLIAEPLLRRDTPDRVARASTALRAWRDNPQERAYAYAKAHPGDVYLPWASLATLLAEGRLDSNVMGVWNRELANIPVSDELWRRHVPPHARHLVYRVPPGPLQTLPSPTARLPEYRERVDLPESPGWVVYRRDAP